MDSDNLVSSVNPANLKSFAGTMKEILRFHDIKQDTCLPAQVVSFDRTTHLAKVQILVQHVYSSSDGVKYESGDVMEIPVLRLQHGMFLADAPLYPGDTGYVVAGHRDGSLAVEGNSKPVLEAGADGKARTNNLGPQPPNTYLLHRYENGFFVPCRWGTVEVDEKDKDSLVVARYKNKTKEIELDGKKVEVYDGVEGKVTLEKDGTVRIVNGTGEIIESDEYRQAEEGETPDKTDANGVGWKKKPTVYIDPTADLTTSDAKFRLVEVPSGNFIDENGRPHITTKKVRILADDSSEKGNDIILPESGEKNILNDVIISAKSYVRDSNDQVVELKVGKWWDGKTIHFGLKLGSDSDRRGYCNKITADDEGNQITEWTQDNDISRTPCGDGGESEEDSGE